MNKSLSEHKPKQSFRLMFKFWLDMHKPEEEALADTIDQLKQERSFSKTIRDGIRLVVSLRCGETDVLEELFPAVVAAIRGNDGKAASEQFNDMLAEIAELKVMVAERQTVKRAPVPAEVEANDELVVAKNEVSAETIMNNLFSF